MVQVRVTKWDGTRQEQAPVSQFGQP
jgi:hypothetical protein